VLSVGAAVPCWWPALATSTAKGQNLVPADLRAFEDARHGARRAWLAVPDGRIIVRARTHCVAHMDGMPKAPQAKYGMNPWR